MDRILVTGATGFIGNHLGPRLRATQHDVTEVNRAAGDIADEATWLHLPNEEVVIHLAGRTFVPDSWADPAGFLKTNLHGTVCALNYCRHHNARMIFSSAYLYGIPDVLPIPESARLHANNPYALSKKLAEDACRFYSDYYGVSVTILRLFNVYGHGQSHNWLIPSIIKQVNKGDSIEVKDLEPKRDYIYIKDVVEAFINAIEKPQRFNVFNIGSGESHSVREVIELIQCAAGSSLPVRSIGQRRPQEVMDTKADIRRAREILGWRPTWSLSDGIQEVVELSLNSNN